MKIRKLIAVMVLLFVPLSVTAPTHSDVELVELWHFEKETTAGLDQWEHSLTFTVDNTDNAHALTDYQVLVELDSTFDFTRAQSDGDDLRFTSQNGVMLPYWIESFDPQGKKAKIWVKVDSIPGSGTAFITMYYGNPTAQPASDGVATFEFFDNFETDTTGSYMWEHVDYGPPPGPISAYSWDPINTWVYITTGDNSGMKVSKLATLPPQGHFFISFRKLRDYPKDNIQWFYLKQDENNYYFFRAHGSGYDPILHPDPLRKYVGGTLVDSSGSDEAIFIDSNTDHTIEGWYTNAMMQINIDGEASDTLTTTNTTQINPVSFSFENAQINLYWYEIRVRKYTDPEPTVRIGLMNHCDFQWVLVLVIVGFICVLLWILHKRRKKPNSEFRILQELRNELKRIKKNP